MARKRASARTPEARLIASRELMARRGGMTQKEYARMTGINPRTLRKIRAGETPGTKVFARKVKRDVSEPNLFRVDLELAPGEYRSVNVRVPSYRDRSGTLVAPTIFDIARYEKVRDVAQAEGEAMQRRYGMVTDEAYDTPHVVGFRAITHMAKSAITVSLRG